MIRRGLEPDAPRPDRQRAERQLTDAYIAWAQALEAPSLHRVDLVVPEALTASADPRDLIRKAARTPDMTAYLDAMERRHPFYDRLRAALAAERAGPMRPARLERLLVNLERTRGLPKTGRHLVVDIGSQRLWMFDGRTPEGEMKVIVGAADNRTPTMISLVEEAIARPYWNVPEDLAQTRIARRVLRQGVQHLDAQHLRLLSDWTDDAVEITPDRVDWKAVAARRIGLRVRQEPGPWNMMGNMKFLVRNNLGIYLHDTPERALFRRSNRALSAGCIRVADWRRLADWLFEGDPPPEDGPPEQAYRLPAPVPIHVVRLTIDPTAPGRTVADPYADPDPRRAP